MGLRIFVWAPSLVLFIALSLAQNIAAASDPASSFIYGAVNSSITRSVAGWQQQPGLPGWLRDAGLELRFEEGFRPSLAIGALVPMSPEKREREAWFFQTRIAKVPEEAWQSSGGFGWRRLSKNFDRLWGLNVFCDREWRRERTAWGLGAEYFWSRYEARANWYAPAAGPTVFWEEGSHWREEVVGGYDLEVGMALPSMPWLKLFVRGGSHGAGTDAAESDWMLRSDWQLTPRLEVEVGYGFGSGRNGGWSVQFSYLIGGKRVPAMLERGKAVFRKDDVPEEDLRDRRFVGVERDWRIRTSRTLVPEPPPAKPSPLSTTDPANVPATDPVNPTVPPPLFLPGRVSVFIERGS